jgi:hypothetical protein
MPPFTRKTLRNIKKNRNNCFEKCERIKPNIYVGDHPGTDLEARTKWDNYYNCFDKCMIDFPISEEEKYFTSKKGGKITKLKTRKNAHLKSAGI